MAAIVILLWARTPLVGGSVGWVLVQGFRYPSADRVWRGSLFWRTLKAPLLRVRPGEDRDGTWRAFHRYDHAPTALEICAFADVSFLVQTRLLDTDEWPEACRSARGCE